MAGYFDSGSFTQQTATVNVEFREVQDSPAPGVRFSFDLDEEGWSEVVHLDGLAAGEYYVLVRHQLHGETYGGQTIPLGSNHLPVITRDSVNFAPYGGDSGETTVNFSEGSPEKGFVEPYVSTHPHASNPMLMFEHGEETWWKLAGGDADANRLINVDDILMWNTAAEDPDARARGDDRFSEQVDFNGDGVINIYDFSVWATTRARGISYAPLPEED